MVFLYHALAAGALGKSVRHFLMPPVALTTTSLVGQALIRPVSVRLQTSSKGFATSKSQSYAEAPPESSPSTVLPDARSPSGDASASESSPSAVTSPGDGSDIPGLAPFKLQELPFAERTAYIMYGPDYIRHMTSDQQREARSAARARATMAAKLEEELGPNWLVLKRACNIEEGMDRLEYERNPGSREKFKKWSLERRLAYMRAAAKRLEFSQTKQASGSSHSSTTGAENAADTKT